MIKLSKFGEAETEQAQVSLGESFQTSDGTNSWGGQEITATSDPLQDGGSGENVLLRVFDFGANPETLKRHKPTKQQLFDSHIHQIRTMLWADGLEPRMDIQPLIQVSKKKEKYRILMWCKAKAGVVWADTPMKLQDLTNPLTKTNVS